MFSQDRNKEAFLSSFKSGEEAAFDTLFRTYFVPLTLFANRIVSDVKTSEDIVQDCFILLWERCERLGHIKSIRSYLYTTVRNQSIKFLERGKRRILPDTGNATEFSIEKSIIATETARELYQLISSLSPALQQLIRLYYLEEKSNKGIAILLNIEKIQLPVSDFGPY